MAKIICPVCGVRLRNTEFLRCCKVFTTNGCVHVHPYCSIATFAKIQKETQAVLTFLERKIAEIKDWTASVLKKINSVTRDHINAFEIIINTAIGGVRDLLSATELLPQRIRAKKDSSILKQCLARLEEITHLFFWRQSQQPT